MGPNIFASTMPRPALLIHRVAQGHESVLIGEISARPSR
jgi:hypothetical protein